MAKILVTGADGFIGSHLVEALVERGHEVKAFVFYNSFNSRGWLDSCPVEKINEVEILSGDIRDPEFVNDAMKGCDVVFHLAALIAIPYSYKASYSYVDTNINGTLNVLTAARKHNVNVVHTSTSECYGTATFVPITEEHPLQAQSPYAATKIAADQLALSFFKSFELPVTILRPFNTYGPRQSARAVIPTVICQIAAGAKNIALGSIHPTRDFNYVADTVRGFLATINNANSVGETINIGSDYEISIGDTVDLISEIMQTEIVVKSTGDRIRPENSEVERLWASNEKAKRILQWAPEAAGLKGLRLGLTQTIEWFQEPKNLKLYNPNVYNI